MAFKMADSNSSRGDISMELQRHTNWNGNALLAEANERVSDNSRDVTRSRCTGAGLSYIGDNERGREAG